MTKKDLLFALLCLLMILSLIALCDLIAWGLIHINKISVSLLILGFYFGIATLLKSFLAKLEKTTTQTK